MPPDWSAGDGGRITTTCFCAFVCVCVCMCVYACMYAYVRASIRTCVHACVHNINHILLYYSLLQPSYLGSLDLFDVDGKNVHYWPEL